MSNIDNRSKASARGAGCKGKARLQPRRSAFTLVELLIVILIIGILVGLLVPAVNMVQNSVRKAAIAMEVQAIDNAIEQYKNKYGDYPPDGSNMRAFEAHCKKVWDNIAPTELAILGLTYGGVPVANAASGVGVMDPAEALVFFLGGFSADDTHPFTGPGGPLFVTNSSGVQIKSSDSGIAMVQYNVDRNEPIWTFKAGQLSAESNAAGTATYSVDEVNLFGATNDCMPVCLSGGGRKAPYVYFNSKTYRSTVSAGVFYYNAYAPTAVPDIGVARPYKSDERNTTVQPSNIDLADRHYRYMNDRSFQLISAGLDDSYGGLPVSNAGYSFTAAPTFFTYPTGRQLTLSTGPGSVERYGEGTGVASSQLDNATNFSDGVLEDALEN